jgi:hypothetical protein
MIEDKAVVSEDGKLDVSDLVRMFEESEESTYEARHLAERDRDYVDNKQLTAEEEENLRKRRQPAVVINRIKGKVEFLVGLEIERRIDPKATDAERFDNKRSRVWKNLIVEGAGGYDIQVKKSYSGIDVSIKRVPWDRMFWDPHSGEPDFSDAGYLGVVTWMDYADAVQMYPGDDAKAALDATMDERGEISNTYDDKPRWRLWADKKRKRVRICQIWVKRGEQWFFAEYTKGGILKSGPSPYLTDKGESDCALAFGSGYVDRENNRYGIVREMISPQDEVNKRRSKALHLLNTVQVLYEDGAIDDIETFRREAARADGALKFAPGTLRDGAVQLNRNIELATAQFQLLQESKNEIDLRGPNATMMGEKTQGSSAASGKAIIASQQGGMMEIGELLDNLRDLDLRAFNKVWYRIRQFWTGEKWIRVTDDERNVKWVVMNVPPQQMQALAAQNPQMAQQISGYVSNIAELECDIIIDDAPDAVTPALEQWEAIVEIEKAKPGTFPTDVLIEAAPNLRNKDRLLERLDQPNPQAELQQRGAMAEVGEKEASAQLKQAQAVKAMAEAGTAGQPDAPSIQPVDYEPPPQLQDQHLIAQIEQLLSAARKNDAQAFKTQREAELAPAKMAQEANDRAADRDMRVQAAKARPKVAAAG